MMKPQKIQGNDKFSIIKKFEKTFSFGDFEWDKSDLARGIEDHLEEEEAPIPVLSPLEVASAPLEKLIEDAKTKVNNLWFQKYICLII